MNRIDFCHLVGLGGTGGALVEPLARLLRFHKNAGPDTDLKLWDGDGYEKDNAKRQIGYEEGLNKASAAASRIDCLDLVQYNGRFFQDSDAFEVAQDPRPGLVVLAVDNFWTRRKTLEALKGRQSPLLVVLPGNESTQGSCLVQTYPIYGQTPDTRSSTDVDLLLFHPEIAKAHDGIGQNGPGCSVNQAREPQTVAANFTAAGLVLWAATNWLDGHPVAPSLSFDFRRGEVQCV